jgi:uncharacterized protein (TIGR00251 family)
MGECPWTLAEDGVLVTIRLTPRGGRDAIDGVERLDDGQAVLKVRVRAPPSDGEANTALARLLAKTLRLAPRDVRLVAGPTSRLKRIKIAGDPVGIAAALERLAGTCT